MALRCAERAEVMLAQQVSSGLAHLFSVKRAIHPTHPARFDTGPDRRFEQSVGIAACDRATARVKFVRHCARPLHGNVSRQKRVGPAHPGGGFAFKRGIKMHHLQQAVHTCVSAACAVDPNGLGAELGQRQLELVLNGVARELALPALLRAAVVAYAKRYSQKILKK